MPRPTSAPPAIEPIAGSIYGSDRLTGFMISIKMEDNSKPCRLLKK
ncbi:Uncharacterised protein [Mycobacteroides abscessus subsp. abscessus]|nr:Uncharacterised protein [Mycobacteroides abscessus subsp. abscessus]